MASGTNCGLNRTELAVPDKESRLLRAMLERERFAKTGVRVPMEDISSVHTNTYNNW